MESVAKGSTSAFCSAPTFSSPCVYAPVHAATAPSRIPVSFRLRNSSKEYNSAFRRSRSKLTPSHSNDLPSNTAPNSLNAYGDTTPQQHLKQELELDSSGGNGVAPPRNGGGSGNGRWHAGESGSEGEGEGVGLDPEVLAILAAAGRDVSSLPPDVRSATASQMHRLLAVERTPLIGWLASAWPALRNRLVANERLPVQLGVELCVGFITKTLAEVQGRGKKFWKEFDFYLSDMALELVGDAMLVWLLSPVALFSGGIESKGIGGNYSTTH